MFYHHPDGWIQVRSIEGDTGLMPIAVFRTLEPAYRLPDGYFSQIYTQEPAPPRRVLSNGRDERIIRGNWEDGDIYISKVLDYIMATIPIEPPETMETTHDS